MKNNCFWIYYKIPSRKLAYESFVTEAAGVQLSKKTVCCSHFCGALSGFLTDSVDNMGEASWIICCQED